MRLDCLMAVDGSSKEREVAVPERFWPDAVVLANQALSSSAVRHLNQPAQSRVGDRLPADLAAKTKLAMPPRRADKAANLRMTAAGGCRAPGRHIGSATLALNAERARRLGAKRLIGKYLPTKKNAMVRDHLVGLGFTVIECGGGCSRAVLDLSALQPSPHFVVVQEG